MPSRGFKIGVFTIEALNALPLSIYFMYLFFYMKERHGFGGMENLLLGGYGGFVYMVSAALAGRFAPRFGYLNVMAISFAAMCLIFPMGIVADSVMGQLAVYTAGVSAMAFVWAPLESLAVQGEPKKRVQKMVGIYNVVWASFAAIGYFVGGAIVDALGYKAMFLIPAAVCFVQLLLTLWLRGVAKRDFGDAAMGGSTSPAAVHLHDEAEAPFARTFLRMAWIANPFAFIASNTVTPTIPTLAKQFDLSKTMAGFLISIWLFARVAAFVGCWAWSGWHYRLRWLLGAYLGMTVSFVVILTVPVLAALIAAQVVFGLSVGMVYYASLYYSMHVGDNHGEQGGVHESAIGAGNCVGPWLGAGALFLLPDFANAAAVTVAALLGLGLVWILRIWSRRT